MQKIAFLSYDRHNDSCLEGRVVEFCKKIDIQLQIMLGVREALIFIDKDAIELSVQWQPEIEDVINNVSVFLPVVSPGWLERQECRREYKLFVDRETRLTNTATWPKNTRLIIPLLLEKPRPDQETHPTWHDLHQIDHPQSIMPFVGHPVRLESEDATSIARKIADRIRDLHFLVRGQIGENGNQSRRDSDQIKARLQSSSAALADWPKTLGDNQWLERPELDGLLSDIETCESTTRFVVGKPGTGKSAMLSSLYGRLFTSGIICLGIKADALPACIASLDDWSAHVLGEKLDLPGLLCEHALLQKVVVIIDQLDALADLVDLHSGRLNVLLDLIARIRDCRGVHLVASVREFELKFDKRLVSLISDRPNRASERIDLLGFSREQVVGVLQHGCRVSASQWSEAHLSFLETPYHLAQFTQHFVALTDGKQSLPHEQFFESIQQAHRYTYEVTIARSKNREALDSILNKLAEQTEQTEELWHAPDQLGLGKKEEEYIDELEGLHWLHWQADGRLGFAHQTQYEHVLGKRFVDSPDAFVSYVQIRQDGLFVRPTVWHSLALMRTESRINYERAMGQLLARISRRHLQRLFIEFLVEVADPTNAEVNWVVGLLESTEHSARMCWLLRGKRGWFERLPDETLDYLMCKAADETWPVCRLIEASWPLENPRTCELIRRNWGFQRDFVRQTWVALSQANRFDDETLTWLMYCASEHPLDDVWYLNNCLKTLCAIRPEWTYRLFSLILHRRIEKHPVPRTSRRWLTENELTTVAKERADVEALLNGVIEDELGHDRWYGIEELAQKDPIAFVQTIWNWFLMAMRLSGERYRSRLLTFCVENDSPKWCGDFPSSGSHLVIAINESLGTWAKIDRPSFLRFVCENSKVDSMTVQRMFARALTPIAHLESRFVLALFRDDTRRFFLDVHWRNRDTNHLLNAMIPHLSKDQVIDLQSIVLAWHMYRDQGEPSLIERYRAELLYNIPGHLRTQEANQLVNQNRPAMERDATRYRDQNDLEFARVTSEFSSTTMSEMSDAELLNAVRQRLILLQDQDSQDYAWNSHDLAHQFSEFVKSDPVRGVEFAEVLTQRLEGGLAGAAVRGLVEVKFDTDQVLDLIRHLADNNYEGREFQDDVGQALRDLAITEKGLPDDILLVMTEWLLDTPIATKQDEPAESQDSQRNSTDEATSVLWPGIGLGDPFPHNWFYIGEAIKMGYCCRPQPNVTAWFEVYSAAVNRPYPSDVWRAWIFELIRFWPNRENVAELLELLIVQRPEVMESEIGIWAVAKFGTWINAEIRSDYLRSLVGTQSPRIQQGAGELAVILQLRDNDKLAKELITKDLAIIDRDNPSPFRLGIAFGAGNTWRWEGMQQEALKLIESLLPSESYYINDAVLDAFNDRQELTDDQSTRDLLSLIAESLLFRKTRDVFCLVDCLKSYVRINPELTYRVMRRMVDGLQQIKQQDALYRIGHFEDEFINIILTIHRQHRSDRLRNDSLTLYEDLLDLEIHGVFESLKVLDQRPL